MVRRWTTVATAAALGTLLSQRFAMCLSVLPRLTEVKLPPGEAAWKREVRFLFPTAPTQPSPRLNSRPRARFCI